MSNVGDATPFEDEWLKLGAAVRRARMMHLSIDALLAAHKIGLHTVKDKNGIIRWKRRYE